MTYSSLLLCFIIDETSVTIGKYARPTNWPTERPGIMEVTLCKRDTKKNVQYFAFPSYHWPVKCCHRLSERGQHITGHSTNLFEISCWRGSGCLRNTYVKNTKYLKNAHTQNKAEKSSEVRWTYRCVAAYSRVPPNVTSRREWLSQWVSQKVIELVRERVKGDL